MDSALTQIIERVRDSAREGRTLCIRGGGTKDFVGGHAVARSTAQRLDMRALSGVIDYEPSELVVTVRAGTPLADLQALLAQRGQCLPFDPPHFSDGATVGGMVAAGLSGPARASAGAVRDYVLGIEIINGKGELLRFGGQVMKNVAGYDVSRLMAGSWGTLAVITEVSLKVLPQAPATATLRFDHSQVQALERVHAWGGQPLPLNASLWADAAGQLQHLVRLRGAKAAVQAACARLGGERVDDDLAQAVWQSARDHQLPWFVERASHPSLALWRLSVPQTAPVLELPDGLPTPLVEWMGAQRWVQAPMEHGPALQAMAQAVGGSAMLFAAPRAQADAAFAAPEASAALASISQQLKRAFDPQGMFQPARMGAGV